MSVQIEWRTAGHPAIPCLEKSEPPGEWSEYKTMPEKDAEEFLAKSERLAKQRRTMFQYRISPK